MARGSQTIAGFDASAIAAGLYTRVERPFVGNIGTSGTPLIVSMTDGSIAQKKTSVVGAGGIGLQIAERIKVRYWNEVSFIILLILVTVAAIDFLSARVRRRLIGEASPR